MFEIGNTLREARLRRGLNVSECEVGTKIRAKYLRAIEDEHFDVLPSPAYVRGFLTTYAEYLGLDGRLFMDEYESRFGVGSEMQRRQERNIRARQRRQAKGRRRRGGRSVETKLAWLGFGGVAVLGVVMLQGMSDGTTDTPFTTTATDTQPALSAAANSEEAPVPLKITLRGNGETGSYIEVYRGSETGKQLMAGVLKNGDTRTFDTNATLWVRTYNAAGLTIALDGKAKNMTGGTATYTINRSGITPAGTGN